MELPLGNNIQSFLFLKFIFLFLFVPRLRVEVVEDLRQQVPVDASVQAVLQQNSLVPVAGWDHAAVHEVELDELCVGQVEVDGYQLSAATLGKLHSRKTDPNSRSVR